MLVFLVTDAEVDRTQAEASLRAAVRPSFDTLNLDGCMSTNDTVLLLANGAKGAQPVEGFDAAVRAVCASLAHQIADDGEGMTKLATIRVRGAANEREARKAANSIAGSVLLRCALNGADPYWGRVLAALGTAGIPLDPNRVDVWMGGEKLAEGGTFGPGDTEKAKLALAAREIEIVELRVPGVPQRLAEQAARFAAELRSLDLQKPPGLAETIDWVRALTALGQQELDVENVQATLGSLLKYHEDLLAIRDEALAGLVSTARG